MDEKRIFKNLKEKNRNNTKVVYPGINPIKKFPEKKRKNNCIRWKT